MLKEVILPTSAFDKFQPIIQRHLHEAQEINWSAITSSDEGKLALTFCETVRRVFQPYIQNPNKLIEDGLVGQTEKPDSSPCYDFDCLAEEALGQCLETAPFPWECFSEESGWHQSEGRQGEKRIIIVDPLDESSALKERIKDPDNNDLKVQGSMMTVTDAEGNFLAAAVVDYQSSEIVFGEVGGRPVLITVNKETGALVTGQLRLKDFSDRPIKIGYLLKKERTEALQKTRFYPKININEYPKVLGAWALIKFLKGEGDFLIDPHKGQPWYEMAPYILIQLLGGRVINVETGEDFYLANLIEKARQGFFRYQFVAGADPKKTEQLLKVLCNQ